MPAHDATIFLSESQGWGVLEAVRNLVLNWSLALEKAGVLGDDMVFTDEEKQQADPVTTKIIIHSLGILGNVSDAAHVEITQVAASRLDLDGVRDFLAQAKQASPLLPDDAGKALKPVLEEIDLETKRAKPDQSKLRALLQSARAIGENISGNVIASGIVTMLGKLLGG